MKAFIITLSEIPASLETSSAMIAPLESYGFSVEQFEGSYGNEMKKLFKSQGRTHHPTDYLENPVKPTRKTAGPGAMGCFYSHYRLWKKCVELNETIFIFEDDVKFVRPYYPVEFNEILLVALGSWDIIYSTDVEVEPNISPTTLEVKVPCLPGAVGYGITPVAAKKLVEAYKNTYTAADSAIRSSIVDIKIHSHLMGRALVDKDGKVSLTRKKDW